jgi:uncharacterized protein YndB with AHSA1/START domain
MTDEKTAAPRIVGSLRPENGRGVVRMDDRYATDIDDLWSALTTRDRLRRWVAEVQGDLRLGEVVQAQFTSEWKGPLRIDVCDAPHHLLVTASPGADDETVMEATLTADGDHTRLVIEERGLLLEELAAHGAGWQAHVEDLAAVVAGREASVWVDRWKQLIPAYTDLADALPQ